MGARPSDYKGGGGFLKDVDGQIVSLLFTDEFNGEAFKPGKKPDGKAKFHSLFAMLGILVDGATEPTSQHLFVGDADAWEVGDDGTSLTGHDEDQQLGKTAPFQKFMASLVKSGFDEEQLPADEFQFEAIINARCRFDQEVKLDKEGKAMKRKAKKGKFAGREFDDTTTIVTKYYGQAEEAAEPAPSGKKASTAAKSTKGGKSDAVDLDELTGTTVIAALEAADEETIKKPKLRMALIKVLGANHPQKEAVLKLGTSDEFLKQLEGVTYSIKSQVLTLDKAA